MSEHQGLACQGPLSYLCTHTLYSASQVIKRTIWVSEEACAMWKSHSVAGWGGGPYGSPQLQGLHLSPGTWELLRHWQPGWFSV